LLPRLYRYDVGNVFVIHDSFRRPLRRKIASYKACAELTLSTVTTRLRTDFRHALKWC